MKKHTTLILLGLLNLLHASTHIFQIIQSFFFASYALNPSKDNWVHHLMESPVMGLGMALLGLISLWLGIRDYRHHLKHKD